MFTFSMRTLILWHHKVINHFVIRFFIQFFVEIADETFQFWIFSLTKIILKAFLLLLCKLTYIFLAINFWCFY